MVVYLDLAFLLNCLTDALALYATARLSGLRVRSRRLLAASLLGGTYGMLCTLPPLRSAAAFFPQMAAAAALVWLAFGRCEAFLRRFLLFFMLSCTIGGAFLAFSRLLEENGGLNALKMLNWKVFLLVSCICYVLLSVVFRGGARHAVEGRLFQGWVELSGRRADFTVLYDTGHTLTDGATGQPVLIAERSALEPLWSQAERSVLENLEEKGAAWCLERLSPIAPGRFRLLPYRAVGVSAGTLLCFRADRAALDGGEPGRITVALSPTSVSDGGGYTALWGGGIKGKGEMRHAA